MADMGGDTIGPQKGARSRLNCVSVAQLPASTRLRETASLLAVGFLRHWLRHSSDGGEKGLDVLRTSSDSCAEPTSEGETA